MVKRPWSECVAWPLDEFLTSGLKSKREYELCRTRRLSSAFWVRCPSFIPSELFTQSTKLLIRFKFFLLLRDLINGWRKKTSTELFTSEAGRVAGLR